MSMYSLHFHSVTTPGFSDSSVGKESACNAGNLGSISGLGGSREKGKNTHFSTLAWKIPWMEDLVGCSPWGREESDTTE